MSRKYLGLAFILVFHFTFFILNSVEMNSLSIVGKAMQPAGEIVPGDKLDANLKQAALVSFITDLDVDMDFKPWNGAVGKITNPAMGRWNVYVSPGERVIDVHALGFEPIKVVLSEYGIRNIKSGEVYHLRLTGEKKVTEVPVVITCNHSGAEVYIDGDLMGTTQNKMLTVSVNQGEREIKIKKDGFGTQSITEDVSVTNNSFNFNLVPAMPAVVKITSDPEGATVTIDGNMKLGETPLDKFYEAGTYPIRIEKENYEIINEQITIIEPKTEKHYDLTDIRATLTVKTHANATVKFNGESYKGGFANKKIAPQVLEIEVTMPKAEMLKRVITLKPKAAETIEMYPEVQTGTIQVMCIPTDAKIELKGDAGEHYTATGRETFTEVPVGSYELTVSADGYKTRNEDFRLIADDTAVKQITLEEGSDVSENMVFVEGGTFQMGSNEGDGDEKPVHSVTLSDFYIGKYEVTQEEYEKEMGKNPSNFKNSGKNAPVETVNWYDAVEFCNKLSDKEGLDRCYSGSGDNIKCNFNTNGYRLPTEAEWEYAAKGGNKSKGYKYSGSNDLKDAGWYIDNSGSITHPVGGKNSNELGIYDMSGNVWEWCWDWKGDYSGNAQTDPCGPSSGSYRVFRGGSWFFNASFCRSAFRISYFPGFSNSDIGFRFARSSK